MTFGSLFTGIGGFDLGFEQSGFMCSWQCEKNHQARTVLNVHWPDVPVFNDVTEENNYAPVDIICGGDPCPIRSRARSNGESKHPDLSGYFLAVVGRLRPRWVVRENVPAPDDVEFSTALEFVGYGTVIVRINADTFTGQCRQRDFIVGCREAAGPKLARFLPNVKDGPGPYTTRIGTREIIPALTTHRTRYDSRDCYIYDGGLRILDGDERTAFAGFPPGWLNGFSEGSIARMTGNAVVPAVAKKIAEMIKKANQQINSDRAKQPARPVI